MKKNKSADIIGYFLFGIILVLGFLTIGLIGAIFNLFNKKK